jgi:23S rRNA (adenine2503-C2)-methyltransferase
MQAEEKEIKNTEDKTDIKSLLPEELESWLKEHRQPSYRGRQIFSWLSKGIESFDEMTNIGQDLKKMLSEHFSITVPRIERKQASSDGTVKYLWKLSDGSMVESVVMCYDYGNTACISTQVGCRMGCAFCASKDAGFVRNLRPSEMLDQVMFSQKDSGQNITNIVLMGIGEPLDNLDNVLRFLSLVNNNGGMNIGMRHISLSTCGLVAGIDKLAEYDLQLTLSISLHAPDDETRKKIMPVNVRNDINALTEACIRYYNRTGRRISFEYALIKGVNDSEEQAKLLSKLMKKSHGHLNLIPLNHVEGSSLEPGDSRRFANLLKSEGVNVTIRRRLGADIEAACGQLRRKGAGLH